MRLVPKLSIYLVGAMSLVFVWRGGAQVRHDTEVFDTDMKRDHLVVGRIVAQDTERAISEGDLDKASRIALGANGSSDTMHFTWLRDGFSSVPLDVEQRFKNGLRGEELVSRFPIRGTSKASILEVRESLVDRDRFVHSAILDMLLGIGVSITVAGLLALLLNRAVVGRPIAQLVDRARRIGHGDLGTDGKLEAADELVDLWAELDAMCAGLVQANDRLTAEASARVRVTEQMRHAERLATVGKLAAGVAHELGTPLSVAAGHAEMIRRREVQGGDIEASARTVEDQIGRASKIVRQLLDFARRQGRADEEADAFGAAEEVKGMMENLAKKRDVVLAVEGDRVRASIPRERLVQVLTNLIGNAIDASMPGGSVTVVLKLVKPVGEGEKRWVRIDVVDHGAGITEENLPRVFEPFFTTKDVGEGTGLGLSVVHGIVHDQGGRVEVESRPNVETTFSVWLEGKKEP